MKALKHSSATDCAAAINQTNIWRKRIVKNDRLACLALALVALLASIVPVQTASAQNNNSLYKRLGGYDALAAVTDDFITALATDKTLGRFFVGASENSKMRIRQLVLDQLCAATGGPCVYIGRDMKTSHKGLGITEDDWNIAVKHLVNTLAKFKVPEKEQKELASALTTLKADIVEK
jgi:hemoglobin